MKAPQVRVMVASMAVTGGLGLMSGCASTSSLPGCTAGSGISVFDVPSAAMAPTIQPGSKVLVDERHPGESRRTGDIIVFRTPPAAGPVSHTVPFLLKRVIGLPGQTISSTNDAVTIDGVALSEPWLPSGTAAQGSPIEQVTIPPGTYYVLGDNRGNSEDSRFFGPIPRSSVVGEVETSRGKVCRP